ncbi:hypothetical protein ABW20_dc0101898 [Dactylellina cionopaga]|nr:hypothetical protein ABW20_dc0101898 [Dactylellina cionopaga]
MSDYNYRPYSPSNVNRSPTRRTVIPPAGTYPPPTDWNQNVHSNPWDESTNIPPPSYSSTPNIIPEVVPRPGINAAASDPYLIPQPSPLSQASSYYEVPPALQPGARGSVSSASIHSSSSNPRGRDYNFATGNTYSSSTNSDLGPDLTFKKRIVRTPSEDSTDRSRDRSDRRSSRQDRTPSTSPTRAIPRDGFSASSSTQRTPSGNLMNSLFNAQNAAAVGSALGSAANFLGSRAGFIKPETQPRDNYDPVPGGYNNRPVPDTASNNSGFNMGDAMNYLSHMTSPQTPQQPPPQQQQPGGTPFTLSNALNYLQHATQPQGAPGTVGNNNNGLPGNFQLAGIDIDFGWIVQKAGEQNPWVLLGGAVVSFWIVSSIIATLIWYGIIAAVLYVIYIVGVKNGGFEALTGGAENRPPPRRISTPGNTGGGWSRPAGSGTGGTGDWRRRY